MNQSNQRILIVEVRAVDGASFDTSQLEEMVVYQDASNKYHVYRGMKRIETIIASIIPRLGNNYRHPLLFDVQVFDNEFEACLASIEQPQVERQRRGRR